MLKQIVEAVENQIGAFLLDQAPDMGEQQGLRAYRQTVLALHGKLVNYLVLEGVNIVAALDMSIGCRIPGLSVYAVEDASQVAGPVAEQPLQSVTELTVVTQSALAMPPLRKESMLLNSRPSIDHKLPGSPSVEKVVAGNSPW
jgi:hypothetical protein